MIQTVLVASVPYPSLELPLLGLRLLDRILIPAKKSGLTHVLFLSREPHPVLPEEFCVIFPDVLLDKNLWKKLQETDRPPETVSYSSEVTSCLFFRTQKTQKVLEGLRENPTPAQFLEKMKSHLSVESLSFQKKEWFRIQSPEDVPRCEQWLLKGLIKDSEGFMSRHLERKISLFVTKILIWSPVTPNAMTLISTGVGLAGATLFISPSSLVQTIGASLFWVHSVLDGCDGEIARLKFLESRWGGILDFWSDNAVHAAVFSFIAAGLAKREPALLPSLLGLSAVACTLLSAGFVYVKTMKNKKGTGPLFTSVIDPNLNRTRSHPEGSKVQKIADFLARRDFIYLVLVLAFFGKIHWFLWMGAVGSPLYFLALIWFNRKESQLSEVVSFSSVGAR